MYDIAVRGDIVLYNRKLKYANIFTRYLIRKYLKVGNYYEVAVISENKERDKYFYKLKIYPGEYWYPYESFDHHTKYSVMKKYDLR